VYSVKNLTNETGGTLQVSTSDDVFRRSLAPLPDFSNATIEDLPTIDKQTPETYVLTSFSSLGGEIAVPRAIREDNVTTELRVVHNGTHFYFTYYEQLIHSLFPMGGPAFLPLSTDETAAAAGVMRAAAAPSALSAEPYAQLLLSAAANATVSIFGLGFDSLLQSRSAAAGEVGAARCRFGYVEMPVVAIEPTFEQGSGDEGGGAANQRQRLSTAACFAPPIDLRGDTTGMVEVTLALNGVHFVSARPPVTYTYFRQRVTSVHPTGGPIGGGTMVTLRGYGLDAMSDGGASLRCSFGSQRVRVESQTVPSRNADSGGGGGGLFEVRCRAPPRDPYEAGGSVLSLSINGASR
jgi:hypothetical protein